MINLEKLQNALVEYKKIFDERWQGEKYKWEAVKWFQDHWEINANDFADMFANNCCDWMHGIIHMAVHRWYDLEIGSCNSRYFSHCHCISTGYDQQGCKWSGYISADPFCCKRNVCRCIVYFQ